MLWYRLKGETTYPATGVVSALVEGLLGEISPEGGQDILQAEPDDPGTQPNTGDRPIPCETKDSFFVESGHLSDGADIH